MNMERATSMEEGSGMVSSKNVLAQVACNSCRSRKRKCDEKKPRCGPCSILKLSCIYDKPQRSKLNTVLENISVSLDGLRRDMDTLVARSSLGLSPSSNPWRFESRSSPNNSPHFTLSRDVTESKFKHATAAHKLYAWPQLQKYAPNIDMSYPMVLEMQRDPLTHECHVPSCLGNAFQANHTVSPGNWYDAMSLPQLRQLIEYYFNELHLLYPILDKTTFTQINLGKFVQSGFKVDSSSCLMLLVLALGSFTAYHHGNTEWSHDGFEDTLSPVGIGFFNEARRIIAFLPKGRVETAQCHLLAGLYNAQLLRLYDFWFNVHEAATIFLSILSATTVDQCDADVIRGYWITYVLESNILAEFDLPMSDLFQFQDLVPLPFGPETRHGRVSEAHADYKFVFLAHIALRRLLNRVHQSIYLSGPGANSSLASGIANPSSTLIQELNSQLEQWLQYIPEAISSYMTSCSDDSSQSLMTTPKYPNNMLDQLRGRYWAARSVIYRPYVYKALHSQPDSLAPEDYIGLKRCLEAAFNIPLAMGILSESPRLIAAPLGPIRSFFAAYILMRGVLAVSHLSSYAGPLSGVAEQLHEKIKSVFAHLSPIVAEDLELLKGHGQYFTALDMT